MFSSRKWLLCIFYLIISLFRPGLFFNILLEQHWLAQVCKAIRQTSQISALLPWNARHSQIKAHHHYATLQLLGDKPLPHWPYDLILLHTNDNNSKVNTFEDLIQSDQNYLQLLQILDLLLSFQLKISKRLRVTFVFKSYLSKIKHNSFLIAYSHQ